MGADNRTTYTPVICPGANNRSIYKATMFIYHKIFIDLPGGRIPGKRVFLGGFNLPENGAWQVLGVSKCLKMDIYGINCMYEMGADNRTTYTPVICPGANNRSIYKATMLIYHTIFIDLPGGRIPGKRVFLGGFNLPENGAWQVLGASKCLKMDIYGINCMKEMGADNRTTYTPVICPGANNRSIYKATMFIYHTIFIDLPGGRIPGKRVFLGGFNLPENGAWQVLGVSKCLKMDIYGINCMYEMGADNRTTYTPVICPGANNRSIYKATMFIYHKIFIDLPGGRIPGKRVFLGGFNLPENGAWQVLGVSKCLKMDIYGINCMYEMGADNRTTYTPVICPGANNRSIYKATMLIYHTIFIDLPGGRIPGKRVFLGGFNLPENGAWQVFGASKCLKMDIYGINCMNEMGADNRTTYTPVICPGANNRSIYKATMFIYHTIFIDLPGGRIPGKRVFLGGFNLPENGAWQVLGVSKCLKMDIYGINCMYEMGADNRTTYTPVICPGANNRSIYKATMFIYHTIFIDLPGGRIPGKRVFLGGFNLPENGAWQVLGVSKCLKMDIYGINCMYEMGADNRTTYTPVICPGANNRSIYKATMFIYHTIFIDLPGGRIPGKRVFLGGFNLPENGAWQVLGVSKCLKMDIYGINCMYEMGADNRTTYTPVICPGANNRSIYKATMLIYHTIFIDLHGGRIPGKRVFLGGFNLPENGAWQVLGVSKCLKMDIYGINCM